MARTLSTLARRQFSVLLSLTWERTEERALTDEVSRPAVARAVTAAAGNFAVVIRIEVLHLHRTPAVELDDLVVGMERTAAIDVGRAASLLKCDGIFADVSPPDIVDRAIEFRVVSCVSI